MKISLWELNQSYQALMRLAGHEFPKEHHKTAYAIARVVRSAKAELELLVESLNDLTRKCGPDPAEYNEQATKFMRESFCEISGDLISLDKIAGVIPVAPMDLVLLDWLFIEEATGEK